MTSQINIYYYLFFVVRKMGTLRKNSDPNPLSFFVLFWRGGGLPWEPQKTPPLPWVNPGKCLYVRGAPDKLSGRIIRPDSWFSDYPVSGRIFLVIRPDSRILKVAF